MVQRKTNRWMHVLLPVLLAALRSLGDAPARSLTALAQRLGVAEADAAPLVTPFKCRLFSYATLGSGGKVRSRAKVVSWLLGHSSGSIAPMGKG